MRTFGNLFERLVSLENLYRSAADAARSKRDQPNVALFFLDLELSRGESQQERPIEPER